MQSMNRREFVVAAASLAFAPRAVAESLGRGPIALVTADLESRLVAVDLASGRVLRHIPTLAYPRSIETVGDRAVVAHSEIGVVSIVRDFAVEHVVRGFRGPRYTAARPAAPGADVT